MDSRPNREIPALLDDPRETNWIKRNEFFPVREMAIDDLHAMNFESFTSITR
jgi:hypothetical protein